ncbi:hypothetical protein PFISCL1PPCAC_14930, partial [Pristionchus fissidentatus]
TSNSFYRFVPYIEASIASISGISMIPLFIVLIQTAILHPNCKVILVLSQIANFNIISMQLAIVIFEYSKGVYLPDAIDGEELFLFFHEFAYGMTTMFSLFLAIERIVACAKAKTYEKRGFSYCWITIVLFVSV